MKFLAFVQDLSNAFHDDKHTQSTCKIVKHNKERCCLSQAENSEEPSLTPVLQAVASSCPQQWTPFDKRSNELDVYRSLPGQRVRAAGVAIN